MTPHVALRHAPYRTDWYIGPTSIMPLISDLPGVLYDTAKGVFVHRTHLPIVTQRLTVSLPRSTYPESVPVPQPEGTTLRPHQLEGIGFTNERRGSLLAFEMRTGKTGIATFSHHPNTGPLVVIAPLNVRPVWLDWIRRRWPDETPHVVQGLTFDREAFVKARIIFAHYDVIRKHRTFGVTPGTLVLDEAHLLSNHKSQRTQACLAFASLARKVVVLTGTPLWNRPSGLWPMLAACNPGAWGKFWDFAKRYGGPEYTAHGITCDGVSFADELRARLDEVMLVRQWKDVATSLPPITRTIETVPVDARQRENLDRAAELDREFIRRSQIGEVTHYRSLVGGYKIEHVATLARQVVDAGDAVVVWAHHRSIAKTLAEKLDGILISGAVSIEERERRLELWRTSTTPLPLVITLAVGQVGIDLSRAHHAIFAELDYTPAVIYQAEMRTYAPTRPMSITYVVVEHPVEQDLADAIVHKSETGEQIGLPGVDAAKTLAAAFDVTASGASLAQLAEAFFRASQACDE